MGAWAQGGKAAALAASSSILLRLISLRVSVCCCHPRQCLCHGLQSVMQLGRGSGGDWLSQDSALIRSGSSESMLPRPPSLGDVSTAQTGITEDHMDNCLPSPFYFYFMFWCRIKSILSLCLILLYIAQLQSLIPDLARYGDATRLVVFISCKQTYTHSMTNIGMHLLKIFIIWCWKLCFIEEENILKIVISGLTKFSEVQTYGREIVC